MDNYTSLVWLRSRRYIYPLSCAVSRTESTVDPRPALLLRIVLLLSLAVSSDVKTVLGYFILAVNELVLLQSRWRLRSHCQR